MNKFVAFMIVFIMIALPVCAMKYTGADFLGGRAIPVRVFNVSNALQVKVIFNKFVIKDPTKLYNDSGEGIMTVYVSNLDCHEFSKTVVYKASKEYSSKRNDFNGVSYLQPDKFAKENNSAATKYVKYLFKEYSDNITFLAKGYGLRNNLVGEFYVNGVSLNQHLIEKGYCSYVK